VTFQKQSQELLKLLKAEHAEDLAQYNTFMSRSTLQQKREQGVSWYPIEIKESGFGLGDYPYLIIERHAGRDKAHQFSAGKTVSLFTARQDEDAVPVNATIHFVTGNTMKIILYRDELPDWVSGGKIGVDLAFDERSYREMENAVSAMLSAEKGRVCDFREIVYGERVPKFDRPVKTDLPNLNDSQNAAVSDMLSAEDIMVIHGPPGTGKTTTLVEGIKLIAQNEKNILVCAPSNAAADLLTEKLASAGLSVVRIGNISRIDESVLSHTPEGILNGHNEYKKIKNIRKRADELRRMALKYKRQFGREEREQRNLLLKEVRRLGQEAIDIENQILKDTLDGADAIVATLVGSQNRYLEGRKFKTLVIDEAAQALEPACWIPMLKAERVILAGDPFQLPPTVKSQEAQRNGLNITLIEKCIQKFERVSLLNTQYRMNESIMGFSNEYFYEGALQAHDSVASHLLYSDENAPVEFIDTAGCSFDEQMNPESQSLYNPGEWQILQKHLELLILSFPSEFIPIIGIISPYREQVTYMDEQISRDDLLKKHAALLTVDTIDSFQGQERDMIYISLVRSNENGEIGFLSDYRRMNVAMTRARKKLVIIGDSATIGQDKFYNQMLQYMERSGQYRSAWELM
jgi:superfamily I DNA and/or RNA helicase